ncbi:Hypothetical protein RLITU_0091 [Romboutsia lituseburensis]|nr:Hypothetical protein RLITU_0091 [Romboutsia lituseburensis]
MNILENENLLVESKNFGAEITRIFSKNAIKIYYGMVILNFGVDIHQYYFLL